MAVSLGNRAAAGDLLAIQIIFDRILGKPPQAVLLQSQDINPLASFNDEEVKLIRERLAENLIAAEIAIVEPPTPIDADGTRPADTSGP